MYCGQTVWRIKMKLHAGRPRPWPHCVRCGPSSPSPKTAQPPPQFSADFYCGQTAGWIKMPLGMGVGLGPSHIMLDGDPVPFPKRNAAPHFSADVYCGHTVAHLTCSTEVIGLQHVCVKSPVLVPNWITLIHLVTLKEHLPIFDHWNKRTKLIWNWFISSVHTLRYD